jgi:hypothetical protein
MELESIMGNVPDSRQPDRFSQPKRLTDSVAHLTVETAAIRVDYPQGTIAIVYPTWKAKTGDLVIARLHDGTVLLKRLHDDGDHYTFISLNPVYPAVTVEKAKIAEVLPVGGTYQEQL